MSTRPSAQPKGLALRYSPAIFSLASLDGRNSVWGLQIQ